MKGLINALLASRPFLWVNTAFPFLAGWYIVNQEFSLVVIIGFLFFLFPYNLAMYGINDIFDYESDIKNPRKASVEGAMLKKEQLNRLWPYILGFTVPFITILYSVGSVWSSIIFTFSLFMVVAYSAAGLRFKEIPILDSVTSSFHFVTPLLFGIVLNHGLVRDYMYAIIAYFIWGMASHAFGAIQDITYDREAGIGSLGTIFGARVTLYMCTGLYLLSAIIIYVFYPGIQGLIVAIAVALFALNTIRFFQVTDATAADTNRGWHIFMALSLGVGALLTTGYLYNYTAIMDDNPYSHFIPFIVSISTFIFFALFLRKKK